VQTSPNGRKLIESFEGLNLKPYKDQRGIWTNGYGNTIDVDPSHTITQEQADSDLAINLHFAESAVNKNVTLPINQNQFDALVSLAYNIGGGAFAHSTLVSLLNQNAIVGASAQFLAWDKTNGVVNQGLLNRRLAERKLFDTPIEATE
jgi:lysozyme